MSPTDFEIIAYGTLALIGIIAYVGRVLNNRDMKRGFCNL